MSHPSGFRTPSGAVKLQVLVTPAEYRELRRRANASRISISLEARTRLAQALNWPSGIPIVVEGGKYQPRGFARRQ